jgi:two-component system response regulator YesN
MTHRHGTEDRRRELYRDAVAVIFREHASDLQIDDVAARVASSRRQLQRVFMEVGGTTFRELLTKVRMHEARRLLALDGTPIQEVAARVGYHEAAQFSKRFRRQFGMSPRAFRKAHQSAPKHRPAQASRRFGTLPIVS